MTSYIVVEGENDLAILREVIADERQSDGADIRIMVAGGYSSAESLARSLLLEADAAVALVVDADATATEPIRERERFLEGSLSRMASKDRWVVIVAVPTLERILFADQHAVGKWLGQELTPGDAIRAEYEPKRILETMLGSDRIENKLRQGLPRPMVEAMRATEPVKRLLAFLRRVSPQEAAA